MDVVQALCFDGADGGEVEDDGLVRWPVLWGKGDGGLEVDVEESSGSVREGRGKDGRVSRARPARDETKRAHDWIEAMS